MIFAVPSGLDSAIQLEESCLTLIIFIIFIAPIEIFLVSTAIIFSHGILKFVKSLLMKYITKKLVVPSKLALINLLLEYWRC